jgi:hypothetical protein
LPYRFGGLARLANNLLDVLGYKDQVDAIGLSWGAPWRRHSHFAFRTGAGSSFSPPPHQAYLWCPASRACC